ncbi:MAG: AMP-binding protein [Deltaproteobacteria bacterium]|nr:AMP-binding protein [Deltaproteobacteria bacterium]
MGDTRLNWAVILEEQAEKWNDKPFLHVLYNDRFITYGDMDRNANRMARYLLQIGGAPGTGVSVLMGNSPQFLDIFFGIQKIGMYMNPVNTALRGESLAYIIDNSDTEILVVDHDLLDLYKSVQSEIPKIKNVVINTLEAPDGFVMPRDMYDLKEAYRDEIPSTKPQVEFSDDSILIIMYTSGTTGLPKGVVARYNRNILERLKPLVGLLLPPDTIYYTPLPLFHGNALFVTVTMALIVGGTVALNKKFSASRFWEDIHHARATIFNTIGAILPILMKQPENVHEKNNTINYVLSGGCPASLWEPFESRFGVKLWEVYGAVDGTGQLINLGDGPKGSIGKPVNYVIRIIDEKGNDIPPGQPGELLFQVQKDRKSTVEYYKNREATEEKTRGEWEYTGDLVYQDEQGYLYFVGRCTDSMRRRGENVSAYEVEKIILKHPAVLECAVYGVPSELTEDDIMAAVKPVEGMKIEPKELWNFLEDKLARFAIPRYIRIVDDFPRTETFRIRKNELKAEGITQDTFDAEEGN